MRWAELSPGQGVVDFDDTTTGVFFVAAGQVRIAVRTPGGQERILDDITAGGIFGDMVAIEGTRVISPPPMQHIPASRIGARREPVSREIAQLCRAGLVQRARGALGLGRPEILERRVAAARQR